METNDGLLNNFSASLEGFFTIQQFLLRLLSMSFNSFLLESIDNWKLPVHRWINGSITGPETGFRREIESDANVVSMCGEYISNLAGVSKWIGGVARRGKEAVL